MSWHTERENGTSGAHPDSAGSPREPNVYHPLAGPGPDPAYDAYADPAAAHGWQNAYDETAELSAMSAPPGVRPGGGGGRRRKKGVPGRRGVVVGAVVGGVGVVSVVALVVGFAGSDASTGGGSGDGGDGVRSSVAASVSPGEDSGEPSAADDRSGPATAGASEAVSASPATDESVPGESASSAASGTVPEAPASPSQAATATATATDDSNPGNSGSKPGRGQGATKGPK